MEYITVNQPYMYLLQSGATVTSLTYFYHGARDGITFTFDTNGPFQGPNRYGYDLFIYTTGGWNKLCNNTDTSRFNGRGCYDWAKKIKIRRIRQKVIGIPCTNSLFFLDFFN